MRVGITGISSDLGRGLLPRLQSDPRVSQIFALDVVAPTPSKKVHFVKIDLTRPGSEDQLTQKLRDAHVDVLYHLAFVNSRVHRAVFAHELEVIGSMHVLAAAQAVGLKRLIVPSLTALYGARSRGAARHRESDPLCGHGVRFITDRIDVEHHVADFARRNTETQVIVLRFAPIIGAHSDNPFTRLLRARIVPTVLGFDPVWQMIHEDDAARALASALDCETSGVFNIVAKDGLPISSIIRLAGGIAIPLAGPLLTAMIHTLEALNVSTVPVALLDYLRYPWLADERRAHHELGFLAQMSAREAIATLHRGEP